MYKLNMPRKGEKEMKNFGFIEYDYIKDILNDHFSGKNNNYKKIYNLFILFSWLKKNSVSY